VAAAALDLPGLVSELMSGLVDFNVQLYRELLKGFAPKVEYSGTLHERPGESVPVVFDSPSMRDVAEGEGLRCILVPPPISPLPPPPPQLLSPSGGARGGVEGSSSCGGGDGESSCGAVTVEQPFLPADNPPVFGTTVAEILRMVDNPAEFEAARLANAQAGAALGFEVVAARYKGLAEALLIGT
jgi:hypothetical protein